MTQDARRLPPAGWYPDPRTKGQERYWAGAEWTDDVRAPQPRELNVPADWDQPRPAPTPQFQQPFAPQRPGELDPFAPIGLGGPVPQQHVPQQHAPQQPAPPRGPQGMAGPTRAPQPGATSARPQRRPASFGARLVATVLDYVLVQIVAAVLSTPILLRNAGIAREVMAELEKQQPDANTVVELLGRIPALDQLLVTGIMAGAWFVYGGLLLQLFGATLGQLALGLRTVPAEDEGATLSAGRAWGRSFAWALLWSASQVIVLAPLIVVACLRVLWSPTRQTWQDVIVRTKVVRRR